MALTERGEKAKALLANPNIRDFLSLISAAEGTTKHGYKTGFDGDRQGHLADLTDHPRYLRPFKRKDGKTQKTSAAGRYQFLTGTWDEEAKKLGLTDFSEQSQDIAAVSRLMTRGAIDDILAGRLDTAAMLPGVGAEWASMPSAPTKYSQPKRGKDWVHKTLRRIRQDEGTSIIPPLPNLQPNLQPSLPVLLHPPQPVAPTLPQGMQMLADALRPVEPLPLDGPDLGAQPSWQEALMSGSIERDADDARSRAVASFLGQTFTPTFSLPKAIERSINKIVSAL